MMNKNKKNVAPVMSKKGILPRVGFKIKFFTGLALLFFLMACKETPKTKDACANEITAALDADRKLNKALLDINDLFIECMRVPNFETNYRGALEAGVSEENAINYAINQLINSTFRTPEEKAKGIEYRDAVAGLIAFQQSKDFADQAQKQCELENTGK